jgi:hypothetical protein
MTMTCMNHRGGGRPEHRSRLPTCEPVSDEWDGACRYSYKNRMIYKLKPHLRNLKAFTV